MSCTEQSWLACSDDMQRHLREVIAHSAFALESLFKTAVSQKRNHAGDNAPGQVQPGVSTVREDEVAAG